MTMHEEEVRRWGERKAEVDSRETHRGREKGRHREGGEEEEEEAAIMVTGGVRERDTLGL